MPASRTRHDRRNEKAAPFSRAGLPCRSPGADYANRNALTTALGVDKLPAYIIQRVGQRTAPAHNVIQAAIAAEGEIKAACACGRCMRINAPLALADEHIERKKNAGAGQVFLTRYYVTAGIRVRKTTPAASCRAETWRLYWRGGRRIASAMRAD